MITLDTARRLLGKTVDCFRRRMHYYPLKVVQMGMNGQYFIIDRNNVAMPIDENTQIPYDFIIEEQPTEGYGRSSNDYD